MAGIIDGRAYGYRAKQNKRIHKYTAVTIDAADTAQNQEYCDIPGGANVAALGLTTEHFVEPNYFVAQGASPTTVTGTTPTLYNLANRGMSLQVNGVARCIAAGAINQGDMLIVADNYGRVQSLAAAGLAAGTTGYTVGVAQHSVTSPNDVVQVRLEFTQAKV